MVDAEHRMREELVASGRFVALRTRGRNSGKRALATLGFVAEPDGSLLIAARDTEADWALNLLADPSVTATWGGLTGEFRAELLTGDEHSRAVRDLILRYGTPSERLGRGPAFRLRPSSPSRRAESRADTVPRSTE